MDKWLRVEQIEGSQLEITFGIHNAAGYMTDPIEPPGSRDRGRLRSLNQKKDFTDATWREFIDCRFWQWPDEGE